MPELRGLFPPIEPYGTGHLAVGDGHVLRYERCGRPGGTPVVFLHGGPGGGIAPDHRRLFDPARHDVLLFDQRGCGGSTPTASTEANTTWHLVEDIERLRLHLGVERWLVFGGSWGATLALAYAQRHPERVTGVVLRGVFLASRRELDWFYQSGASEVFPEAFAEFVAPIPEEERHDLRSAYGRRLFSADERVSLDAARAWSLWEGRTIRLLPQPGDDAHFGDPAFALAFARLENHFFAHGAWLEEGQLLRGAHRLAGIPGVIVQGRYDMVCPPRAALDLHAAWSGSTLRMVEGAGHAWQEPGILDELIRATGALAPIG